MACRVQSNVHSTMRLRILVRHSALHVKVDFIVAQKMYVLVILGRFVKYELRELHNVYLVFTLFRAVLKVLFIL